MNSWVKRIGQLAVLAVALFFLSCQDETSLLGYKNPTSKFKLSFIDLPVESSILLLDSVRTSNYNESSDVNRWLVGKYTDPKFGEISATTLAEFFPLMGIIDSIKNTDGTWTKEPPVFDSISMLIRHDFYAYGANGNTYQEIGIHELSQRLVSGFNVTATTNTGGQQKPQTSTYPFPQIYFNNSINPYEVTEIGSTGFNADLNKYNEEIIETGASVDPIWSHVTLDAAFGQRLFDYGLSKPDSFRIRSSFSKSFKGLALVPKQGDKVIGFSPEDDSTKIELHYHNSKDTLKVVFTFNGLVSYSKITNDRTTSNLAGLTNFFEPTDLAQDLRYIQAGTGVVTKIDFSEFNKFADSDTISRMAINSAEFVIKNIEDPQHFIPPQSLIVKLLKANNRPKKLSYPGKSSAYQKDRADLNAYNDFVNFNIESRSNFYSAKLPFDSTLNIVNDLGTFFSLNYSKDNKSYKGTGALFFQQLFLKEEGQTRFTQAILYPYAPKRIASDPALGRNTYGRTLNRVAFHKDNLVLRIYYTVPTANQNQ